MGAVNDDYKPLQFDDGYVTALRSWGDPVAAQPVLLLHGLLSHSGTLEGLGRSLAERASVTCFAYDRRGAGTCLEGRGDSPGLERSVEDVIQAARTIGRGRPVHLFGWCGSFGFAAHAAARAPDLFSTFTLLAPFFAWCDGPIPVAAVKKFFARAEGKPTDELIEGPDFWPFLVDEPARAELARDERILRKITPRLPDLFLEAAIAGAALVPQIKAPKTVMIATGDQIIDSTKSRPVAEGLFGAENVIDVAGPHATWHGAGAEIADIFARTALRS